MKLNALTEAAWIPFADGALTPRDCLLRANELNPNDLRGTAYEISSVLRFLMSVTAVVLRYEERSRPEKLSERAVDAALSALEVGSNLFDSSMPFMQRPPLSAPNQKSNGLNVGPGDHPVKKLLPGMPPSQAESFWDMSSAQSERLPLDTAILRLVAYHYFSMVGNNSYAGDKCAMGAPGIRFPGKGYSATEVFWWGENLQQLLLRNVPSDWVAGTGLPAWVDRECAKSQDGIAEHPLWRSTWGSNTVVAAWEGTELVGVRVCGIQENWYSPSQGMSKNSRKEWWDQRNTEDPNYLYVPDAQGTLRAQRLDLGRDAVELAVEWNARGNALNLERAQARAVMSAPNDVQICFVRHRVDGTGSSPSIRASDLFLGDRAHWAPDESVAESVKECADRIQELHRAVTQVFRRKVSADKAQESSGWGASALDSLAHRKPDASTEFWRNIAPVFEKFISRFDQEQSTDALEDRELWNEVYQSAIQTFDSITEPHQDQFGPQIAFVRYNVVRNLYRIALKELEDEVAS